MEDAPLDSKSTVKYLDNKLIFGFDEEAKHNDALPTYIQDKLKDFSTTFKDVSILNY